MKLYYIIRSDGSSVFEQGFSLDFISHCFYLLSEQSEERYQVVSIAESLPICAVQANRGKGDESPLFAARHAESILTYILK